MAKDPGMFNTMPSSQFIANGSHMVKVDKSATIEMLKSPMLLGPEQYTSNHRPNVEQFEKKKISLNLEKIHKDKVTK